MLTDLARQWIEDFGEDLLDREPQNRAGQRRKDDTVAALGQDAALVLWVEWSDHGDALSRAIKPLSSMEKFTLLDVEEAGGRIWRCSFAHVGCGSDLDRHILSLLRRLAPTARWVKVARSNTMHGLRPREVDAPSWENFGRRLLP